MLETVCKDRVLPRFDPDALQEMPWTRLFARIPTTEYDVENDAKTEQHTEELVDRPNLSLYKSYVSYTSRVYQSRR